MIEMLKKTMLLKKACTRQEEIRQLLLLSCCFSFLLMSIRIVWTQSFLFLFLPWNLFLASLPYFISTKLLTHSLEKSKLESWFLFTVWLLLIPNSFYIITDLFHLGGDNAPEWFDLVLIFSFAWNGLLMGILSVQQVEKIIAGRIRLAGIFFIYPLMWVIVGNLYRQIFEI